MGRCVCRSQQVTRLSVGARQRQPRSQTVSDAEPTRGSSSLSSLHRCSGPGSLTRRCAAGAGTCSPVSGTRAHPVTAGAHRVSAGGPVRLGGLRSPVGPSAVLPLPPGPWHRPSGNTPESSPGWAGSVLDRQSPELPSRSRPAASWARDQVLLRERSLRSGVPRYPPLPWQCRRMRFPRPRPTPEQNVQGTGAERGCESRWSSS